MSATNREPAPFLKMAVANDSEPNNALPRSEQSSKQLAKRWHNLSGKKVLTGQPSSIRVRGARSEDLPGIVAVLLTSFYPKIAATQWLYWLMRIGIREDIRTRLKTHSSQYSCLVAASIRTTDSGMTYVKGKAAGTVIGTIEISQRPCETWRFLPPKRAYLSNLAIDQTYRRQGAAKQLLHACEQIALQWGFHRLYLHVMADNQAAQALYAQAGYHPCEVSNPILAGLGIRPERLLLSKSL